jgi:hypothetical protein
VQATSTKGMARKSSGEGVRDDHTISKELYDKLLKELVGVKERELKLFAERRRLVNRISLIAPSESRLTGQRRWNTVPPPLPESVVHAQQALVVGGQQGVVESAVQDGLRYRAGFLPNESELSFPPET